MPNSLKCRLKRLANQGLLSEKDLSRIYTDNDVVEELEKIHNKIDLYYSKEDFEIEYNIALSEIELYITKRISELKGE